MKALWSQKRLTYYTIDGALPEVAARFHYVNGSVQYVELAEQYLISFLDVNSQQSQPDDLVRYLINSAPSDYL